MAVNYVVYAGTLFSSEYAWSGSTKPPKYPGFEFVLYSGPGICVVGTRGYPKYHVWPANPRQTLRGLGRCLIIFRAMNDQHRGAGAAQTFGRRRVPQIE